MALFHLNYLAFIFLWYWGLKARPPAMQVLYLLSHASGPFWFITFSGGVFAFLSRSALWPQSFYSGHIPHHAQFVLWVEILLTFCPGWPQTRILLTSTFQVVGMTDISHHTQPLITSLKTLTPNIFIELQHTNFSKTIQPVTLYYFLEVYFHLCKFRCSFQLLKRFSY
jgi:hypothetical protein